MSEVVVNTKPLGIHITKIGISTRLTFFGNDINFAFVRKGFGATKNEISAPLNDTASEPKPTGTIGFHATN